MGFNIVARNNCMSPQRGGNSTFILYYKIANVSFNNGIVRQLYGRSNDLHEKGSWKPHIILHELCYSKKVTPNVVVGTVMCVQGSNVVVGTVMRVVGTVMRAQASNVVVGTVMRAQGSNAVVGTVIRVVVTVMRAQGSYAGSGHINAGTGQ